ncbi:MULTISPECIES: NAD(P)H-dependent oxidoreductase [Streptomyces]|uniref:NAD(P)H-dependent oxidoreductase n=1 Tax=Streptomyces TaxID=1883 RepID=UPI001F321A5B|nr:MULTISPECIES: NAD(P)H-dependent oxidoreductase [Streptomyces]
MHIGVLRLRGAEVSAYDLYAEGFAPLLSADETGTVEEAASPQDAQVAQVALHRTQVATLDALAFVHPNWWGMPPAVLTAWPTSREPRRGSPPGSSRRAGPWC